MVMQIKKKYSFCDNYSAYRKPGARLLTGKK